MKALLFLLLLGCADRPLPLPDETADLLTPDLAARDLAIPAMPDLAMPDLAAPDLAAQGLTLVAGALGAYGNADGTGDRARFPRPSALVSDGAGNLYVSSATLLRKISFNVVTTLAGSPIEGVADGTGTDARFRSLQGLTLDGGNLYAIDGDTIRKIVLASGVVTSVAGSPGSEGSSDGLAAEFNQPTGIAADGAGNLYVADNGNQTIRKIVLATGAVTTLAGAAGVIGNVDGPGATARFYRPYGLFAGAGNLYVTDRLNATVRKIVLATGEVSTLAGAGMSGNSDGAGASAHFYEPTGITGDSQGNLYVCDYRNARVRKLSGNVVTTLAGNIAMDPFNPSNNFIADGTGANARFAYLDGITADGQGNLFVSDESTVRRIVIASGAVTTPLGAEHQTGSADGSGADARFYLPRGIAADGAGNLFVTDEDNATIREIAGGQVTTVAGAAGMLGHVDGTGAEVRFSNPYAIVYDGAGKLYITEQTAIRQLVIASGAVTTLLDGSQGDFSAPSGIALDGAGNLFFSEQGQTIRKLQIATGVATILAGAANQTGSADGTGVAAQFCFPGGLAFQNGYLYVSDTYNHALRRIEVASGVVTTLAGLAGTPGSADGSLADARFHYPDGLAFDSAGNLWVADTGNSTIRKLANGIVTTPVGTAMRSGAQPGPLPGGLNCPAEIVFVGEELAITDPCEGSVLIAHHP